MNTLDHILASWPWEPWLAASLAVSAAVYCRGWWILRRRDWQRWNGGRLAAFLGGLAAIYLALASPIETFASFSLPVHMIQHLLLMMAAPPLLWLAAPMLSMLRGMPRDIRLVWIAPLLKWRRLQKLAAAITHPAVAWVVFTSATWFWHFPAMYELALAEPLWHYAQHLCFLAAGLVFWYPVVRPYPGRPVWPTWLLVPYLILADIQNTVLSALLTFSDRVLYPYYETMPRLGSGSALDEQAAAGVLMWVPGSVAFLLPLGWIGLRLMRVGRVGSSGFRVQVTSEERTPFSPGPQAGRDGLQSVSPLHPFTPSPVPSSFPIPHSPFRILRSLWFRRTVQAAALIAAAAIIIDGLFGPEVSPMNLAGVVPWIHWRGFVVFGLLAIGNIFCYGCPFMLPRTIARRWLPAGANWPQWLRSKWLAVALVAIFLWIYEAFSLWDSPWLTAWIAIAYFVGALVIDGIFRDAPFCKYVCPIGQFHFVQSIVSPLEVRVRRPAVCTSCTTHDCIVGRADIPGCELHLFQPRKNGNLDCTFCLDCVRACPQENVGVLAVLPTASLWKDGPRSGVGRLSQRLDYAALALVLVFGAFANAAGMVGPVVGLQEKLAGGLGLSSTLVLTTVFYGICLFFLPAICVLAAATASRRLGFEEHSTRTVVCRFAWSLVPLGFAMWFAHYSFHFFTSFDTIVPATQRFAADFGLASLGSPDWTCACCRPAPDWLLKAEFMMLDIGLLASLYAAWRMAWSDGRSRLAAMKIAAPWAILATLLFALGVWILLQPMEMRGTMPG